MRTSGIYSDSFDDVRYCGKEDQWGNYCEFEGMVEVFFDTEHYNYVEWWHCPFCGFEHEEDD